MGGLTLAATTNNLVQLLMCMLQMVDATADVHVLLVQLILAPWGRASSSL